MAQSSSYTGLRVGTGSRVGAMRRGIVAAVTLALVVGAPTLAGASPHQHRTKPHGALVRVVKSKKYGKILVDASGRTLYVLTGPSGKRLDCTGACTSLWPPLTTKGKPRAGKGANRKKLGTFDRGKARQVTYAGRPVYLFSGDTGSGQVHGEAIKSFGGTWYVLGWNGTPVKALLSSAKKGTGSSSSGGGSSSGGSSSSSGSGW